MPKDEEPLDAAEIALIRAWIDQGARPTPTSPPAPPPWEAPLALDDARRAGGVWPAWTAPLDRFVAAYLARRTRRRAGARCPMRCSRGACISTSGDCCRRRSELQAFVADRAPASARRSSRRCSPTIEKYAEHWMSFWNDLLRNEDGVTYFSETAGRKSITRLAAAGARRPTCRTTSS